MGKYSLYTYQEVEMIKVKMMADVFESKGSWFKYYGGLQCTQGLYFITLFACQMLHEHTFC